MKSLFGRRCRHSRRHKAKKGLNRSISDASWNELSHKIEYMAAKSGKVFVKVNPRFTSQKCNECGHIESSNRDKEKFICLSCGHMTHADINAAKNLEELAMSKIASMVRRDSTEPEPRGSKRPRTVSSTHYGVQTC